MALDRWIALIFILFCCTYGDLAFFTMDQDVPPFMQSNPVWPSTFPQGPRGAWGHRRARRAARDG